jgi:hypothetical protein
LWPVSFIATEREMPALRGIFEPLQATAPFDTIAILQRLEEVVHQGVMGIRQGRQAISLPLELVGACATG